MAERDQDPPPHEIDRLRAENEKLRQSLAKVQAERDGYLKALYEEGRKNLHFEDVDIAELRATSAGAVELLD